MTVMLIALVAGLVALFAVVQVIVMRWIQVTNRETFTAITKATETANQAVHDNHLLLREALTAVTEAASTSVRESATATAAAMGQALQTALYPPEPPEDPHAGADEATKFLARHLGLDPDMDHTDPTDAFIPPRPTDAGMGLDPSAPFGIPGLRLEGSINDG